MGAKPFVALDIGGVLALVNRKIAAPRETRIFSPAFDLLVRGQISGEDYLGQTRQNVNDFNQLVRPALGASKLLQTLAAPWTLWSNINVLHFRHLAEAIPELDCDHSQRALSFELGLKKPEPDFIRAALARLSGFDPIYYFDDNAENIRIAKAHGVVAEQVQGIEALARALEQRGLMRSPDAR